MDSSTIIEKGRTVLLKEAAAISRMAERLDGNFAEAVAALGACKGKVIISGMGKSGIVGQKMAATMSSTGTTAVFLHPAEAAHGDLGMVQQNDVVIGLSKSGTTEELNFIIPPLRQIGVTIIAMTGSVRSYLGENADITLDTGIEQEACPYDLAPTTSTTAMLAMGDALSIALMEEKSFTQRDFALSHPKGALGRRLTIKLKEIMATGEAVPIVRESDSMSEMILEMTSKRYGVSAVVDSAGRLTGIFTDGDLRRLVQQGEEFLSLTAGEVMTPNPKTADDDMLAKECLDTLETYRITQLMVCNNQHQPVGLIHLHDLLALGL
ncbi:KpsF/GutQ family sugar-phosphate isomerase [Chlorobium phaeovibrioides]|uniref:KpsF/GutQ family sugar-phosphate isomerase n=2 Tax=Chlorobium phaeovibrioides TaxID=1094 RepID=A0A432AVU5_CHLPH|nr:KpsF/GutQ family sugar-phosphate isomerase [Chlorobium phaeovibrioides]HCD35962.1 KpsF/GutQ family sugar-phosphate isomerase [Chlorobium sp.]KAA6230646.1 KpsF/GutQ family sugar-phosphate isomerase [Chlorobium phaeovibrioides]MWV54366.1 KpsF/GutQ family sugar-phosphate isomerase [Chlorobium phaeovibrioides]QEQ56484.1 KpsF/GutQ family sugar-phosphate isomerase [Chlorobium phaeovibrioides]RTY35759.1 KpsF/GutQ family sugar-phosphate isomerase [Chlorobium phaeovibrioides]